MIVRHNYRHCIVVEHTARWPIITLHLYRRETLDGRCILKFIMPSSRIETETESAYFFTKPAETDRSQDFENRNNTMRLHVKINEIALKIYVRPTMHLVMHGHLWSPDKDGGLAVTPFDLL